MKRGRGSLRERLLRLGGGPAADWTPAKVAPKGLVRSFGGVVRRMFPESVGAILQDHVEAAGWTLPMVARRLQGDAEKAARLLTSTRPLTADGLIVTARALAKELRLPFEPVQGLLRDAWVRREFVVRRRVPVLKAARKWRKKR